MTEQELRDLIKGNIAGAYEELANESKTQADLETLVKDLDFNPYLNFAEENIDNKNDANQMQEFLDNISDKDAKKLIKNIKNKMYEDKSIEEIDEKIEVLNINEGQFSWFTQDTDRQIGSEKLNTITVFMHDNDGNSWREDEYEGYGVFGGYDYYDLLAEMNGYRGKGRDVGIDLAFNKKKSKSSKKTLFPALTEKTKLPRNHDFTKQPDSDPDQSWYQEEEDYDNEY